MNPIPARKVGPTDVCVTEFGCGTAPLGDLFTVRSEATAQETLQTAWDCGIRYYDTAPFYGHTKSEHRLGYFLRQQNREEFVISTKLAVFSSRRTIWMASVRRSGAPRCPFSSTSTTAMMAP